MRDLMLQFSNNIFIEILMLAICADTLLGVLLGHQVSTVQQFCGYRRSYQKGGHGCQCRDFDAGGFTDSCESSGFYT